MSEASQSNDLPKEIIALTGICNEKGDIKIRTGEIHIKTSPVDIFRGD
jgi:hypothetical protein